MELGVTGVLMGFLTSIRNLISSLFQGIFGSLSDKFGRKRFLILSLIISFCVSTILIFAGRKEFLIVAVIVQSFAFCIFTPSWNASLGDITTIHGRAAFLSKLSTIGQFFSMSFSLIISLLFYLAERFQGWIVLGWIVNIPWQVQYSICFGISTMGFLFAFISVLLLKETNQNNIGIKDLQKKAFNIEPFKNMNYRRFMAVHLIFATVYSSIWPVFPIIQIEVLEMNIPQITLVSAVFAIFTMICQLIGGKLAEKIGRKKVILIGVSILVLFPISFLPAIMTENWWYSIIANVVGGAGSGFFYITINTYILDLAPRNLIGSYIGLKEALNGIATFIGSFSAGFIIDALVNNYDYITMGMSMAIGVTILRLLACIGYFFIKETKVNDEKNLVKTKNNEKN